MIAKLSPGERRMVYINITSLETGRPGHLLVNSSYILLTVVYAKVIIRYIQNELLLTLTSDSSLFCNHRIGALLIKGHAICIHYFEVNNVYGIHVCISYHVCIHNCISNRDHSRGIDFVRL